MMMLSVQVQELLIICSRKQEGFSGLCADLKFSCPRRSQRLSSGSPNSRRLPNSGGFHNSAVDDAIKKEDLLLIVLSLLY